jgi:hypothetical protein
MFVQALAWELPNITTVRAIIRLAWAASSGNLQLLNATHDELHRMHDKMATKMPDGEDVLGTYDCPNFYGKDLEYLLHSVKGSTSH